LVNPDLEKILNRNDETTSKMNADENRVNISTAEKDIANLLKQDGVNVNKNVEKNINELIKSLSEPYFIPNNNTDEEKSAQYDAFIGNKITKFLENPVMAQNPAVQDALNKEINQWAHIYFPNNLKDKQKGGAHTKEQMQEAADLIIKICGNSSILINQIVPSNFDSYWNILKPLMKDKYQNDASPQTKDIKNDLFEVVVTRDNVGEAMWYIYTGVLLTAIVQLKITSRGCVSSPKTMEENYNKFVESEKKAQEEKELATSTTYTMTN
jgi:hypothetical protein